jgi:hypothetical protein
MLFLNEVMAQIRRAMDFPGGIGLAVAFFASPGGLTLLSGVLIVLVAGILLIAPE